MNMAKIIDGKAIANAIQDRLRQQISIFTMKFGRKPGLAVIMAGDDSSSKIYVRNKIKACEYVGIRSESYAFNNDVTYEKIIETIDKLNNNIEVDGILVQLPLPPHLNAKNILPYINPKKDVDGYGAQSIGSLMLDNADGLHSCTPLGCMQLINFTGIDLAGKNAVVVGRSNEVGKPLAIMLLKQNATVTICHSYTKNLADYTRNADVLAVAVGKPNIITGDMVKDGAVVIDVGINRVDDKLVGDVDFESVSPKCSFITPVPGGVGPMTIAMLMANTLKAAKRNV